MEQLKISRHLFNKKKIIINLEESVIFGIITLNTKVMLIKIENYYSLIKIENYYSMNVLIKLSVTWGI